MVVWSVHDTHSGPLETHSGPVDPKPKLTDLPEADWEVPSCNSYQEAVGGGGGGGSFYQDSGGGNHFTSSGGLR